jgi:hypothetical protein
MMFPRQCDEAKQHEPHVYDKFWRKADLPELRHPDLYPESWYATYQCPGVAILAWTVEYLHEDCTPCEACADMATEAAVRRGSLHEVWRELGPGESVLHMAEVTRV